MDCTLVQVDSNFIWLVLQQYFFGVECFVDCGVFNVSDLHVDVCERFDQRLEIFTRSIKKLSFSSWLSSSQRLLNIIIHHIHNLPLSYFQIEITSLSMYIQISLKCLPKAKKSPA